MDIENEINNNLMEKNKKIIEDFQNEIIGYQNNEQCLLETLNKLYNQVEIDNIYKFLMLESCQFPNVHPPFSPKYKTCLQMYMDLLKKSIISAGFQGDQNDIPTPYHFKTQLQYNHWLLKVYINFNPFKFKNENLWKQYLEKNKDNCKHTFLNKDNTKDELLPILRKNIGAAEIPPGHPKKEEEFDILLNANAEALCRINWENKLAKRIKETEEGSLEEDQIIDISDPEDKTAVN